MKNVALIVFYTLFLIAAQAQTQRNTLENQLSKKRVRLPNGWHLSPAGRSLPLGDLPLNLALSPSKKWIAATNNGQGVQSIQLIDTRSEKVLHSKVVDKAWYGLKFSGDDKFLYASGGNDNWILKYAVINNQLQLKDSILLGKNGRKKFRPLALK
jgi:DNA-binding beta-propeller fold protein YncE